MKDELVWDLSLYGTHNILDSLERKIELADYHFDCDEAKRTIINVDQYENIVIRRALYDYREKIEKQIKEKKNDQ